MKIKTILMLSQEVLEAVDKYAAEQDRSQFIESALWTVIRRSILEEQAQRDLDILNQYADELNEEAVDVLEYQVDW